ncbi:IS630 family transposase [Wenzhouxiangella sp. XN79A]|uniref:IS630 family transposase n=1 Tax=Wenzhouxiangella sp. XN79A TaxID=2724193 RepID=UPI00144A8464|nr:IS630 family transposase [Wenzhouxiangella sp. XN79A]NKI35250.1 IS630 family transposase [Wenzhouxiangella sp. XN79A]
MRVAPKIVLESAERELLKRLAGSRSTSVRLAERLKIVLLAADGKENGEISGILGMSRQKVGRWRNRYHDHGLAGIEKDAYRPGRKKVISKRTVDEVIRLTTQEKPANATHWSRRLMAEKVNISESTVGRIWQAHGLKPHRVSMFKLSNDKHFQEKLEDVVGLYLSPPENAIVLSCDEKSQMQALDRTQPGLPMKPGRNATMTHDYRRNGTSTLFAALNILTGEVLGRCDKRHRHIEWLDFLGLINKNTPEEKGIHIICDNHATHEHPKVKSWLKCHKRFHVHFTPTSASWLNMVERFFRDLSEQQLGRGVFSSVAELEEAVMSHIEKHDRAPAPFIWTTSAQGILEKVERGRQTLNKLQSV